MILRNNCTLRVSKPRDFRRVDGSSNFANEGIEIAPGLARVDPNELSVSRGPICKGRLSLARRRNRTFVYSLNERRIMLPPFLHLRPSSPREKENGLARAAIIFGQVELSWVERSYHSHICKPTGRTVWKLQARDALSLVLSVGHGPRGDGKITGTKLVWPPSRGRNAVSRFRYRCACERARVWDCTPRACVHYC